jgi:hypothetical protein
MGARALGAELARDTARERNAVRDDRRCENDVDVDICDMFAVDRYVCGRIHVCLAEADESSSKTDESLQLLPHISGGVPLRKALDRALLPMHTAHPPPCVQMTARSSSTVHCMWSCGHVAGCQILAVAL